MIRIPLTKAPEQTFRIKINAINYEMRVCFNSRTEHWSIDIADNEKPLVMGVAMLSGVNMLAPYNLSLPNMITLNVAHERRFDPEYSDFGESHKLVILTESDFE